MSRVKSCDLHGLAGGVCGAPAHILEQYPNGHVRTVHIAVRQADKARFVTSCWATPGPPQRQPGAETPSRSGQSGPETPTPIPPSAAPGLARSSTVQHRRCAA